MIRMSFCSCFYRVILVLSTIDALWTVTKKINWIVCFWLLEQSLWLSQSIFHLSLCKDSPLSYTACLYAAMCLGLTDGKANKLLEELISECVFVLFQIQEFKYKLHYALASAYLQKWRQGKYLFNLCCQSLHLLFKIVSWSLWLLHVILISFYFTVPRCPCCCRYWQWWSPIPASASCHMLQWSHEKCYESL